MKRKKTVFIFGLSSFLGSNLAEFLKDDYTVVGTFFETPIKIPGVLALKCNVQEKEMVHQLVYFFKPDITIYAVGLTDQQACQDFPKLADALNTVGVFNVSSASERYGSKLIYFSSSYIFSGENTILSESDTPVPSSIYGNSVASSEFYIQKSCLNYIIFRCCPIFGRSYNPHTLNWMEILERCNYSNQRICCDTKVYTGFMDVWTLSEIVKMAIEENITNRLLQVSSSDVMNRFEFARKFFEIFKGNSSLLERGDWKYPRTENQIALQDVGEDLYFKMVTQNLESLFKIQTQSIEQMLIKTFKNLSGQYNSNSKVKSSKVTFI